MIDTRLYIKFHAHKNTELIAKKKIYIMITFKSPLVLTPYFPYVRSAHPHKSVIIHCVKSYYVHSVFRNIGN